MGVQHLVLLDDQPITLAFTVLAQLGGPRANETEIGVEERNFVFLNMLKWITCLPCDTASSS